MTEQDRFGLSGAPDIQWAQRRQFGSAFPLYSAVLLGLSGSAATLAFVLVGDLRNVGKLLVNLTAQRTLDVFDIGVTVLVSVYVVFLGIKLSRQQ